MKHYVYYTYFIPSESSAFWLPLGQNGYGSHKMHQFNRPKILHFLHLLLFSKKSHLTLENYNARHFKLSESITNFYKPKSAVENCTIFVGGKDMVEHLKKTNFSLENRLRCVVSRSMGETDAFPQGNNNP